MHIWTLDNWKKYYNENNRSGLRTRFDKNVDSEVRRACKEFCVWLREEYYFPQRVVIYFKSSSQIRTREGEMVSATFLEPLHKNVEPYIKISTGDYQELTERRGKDNALAAILRTIAHELTHYFQWINNIELTEIGYERQAKNYSEYIVYEYSQTKEHP